MRAFFLVLLILPSAAQSWGRVGHHVVCQIAYEELAPQARAEVDRLLALDPDYDNFAESCTFADFPERQRPIEHYVNFPRSTRSVAKLLCPMADDCVLTAIPKDEAIFGDKTVDDQQRLVALKLLGHWVADIHQPFHTGFGDDAGANWVATTGACESNLHATWDTCILESRLGTDYLEIAATLRAAVTTEDRNDWIYDGPVEWTNESFRIAISKPVRYCVYKEEACWYDNDNFMLSPGEARRSLEIRPSYLRRHGPTVEQRLSQAGVRLGALINRTVAAMYAPPPEGGRN